MPTYYDDVADDPQIDEVYTPNNKDELIINELNNGKYVIVKNDEVVIEGGINTIKEAQEKFVETYNILRAEDHLKDIKDVPFLEITPEMKMDIYEKGVPIAKVKKKKVKQQSTRMA